MTQPAVADAIGVTPRAYQAYEAGGGIKLDNARKLAIFFGVEVNDILQAGVAVETQLDRIESARAATETQLDRIERALDRAESVLRHNEEILERLVELAELRPLGFSLAVDDEKLAVGQSEPGWSPGQRAGAQSGRRARRAR